MARCRPAALPLSSVNATGRSDIARPRWRRDHRAADSVTKFVASRLTHGVSRPSRH
jgi:hypothetical protein